MTGGKWLGPIASSPNTLSSPTPAIDRDAQANTRSLATLITLKKLKANPKPVLTPSLESLKLTYAVRNEHFGVRCVRHFPDDLITSGPHTYSNVLCGALVKNDSHLVRDDLPRIQYANPTIAIEVNRIPKAKEDTRQSSSLMEFGEFPHRSTVVGR